MMMFSLVSVYSIPVLKSVVEYKVTLPLPTIAEHQVILMVLDVICDQESKM